MDSSKISNVHGYPVHYAFLFTFFAGFSTCIGALVVVSKRLVHLAQPSHLALALGMSAGVMIFISLVEIFNESLEKTRHHLVQTGQNHTKLESWEVEKLCSAHDFCKPKSVFISTICFVFGVGVIIFFDFIVHKISPNADHELNIEELTALNQETKPVSSNDNTEESNRGTLLTVNDHEAHTTKRDLLNRTGILTAIAIAIHNLPEGFAVFMTARENTKDVWLLAISIGLHNIPEGVAVAAPVYYAKRSKVQAFLWTLISAFAEPLGGLLCWLLFHQEPTPILIGIAYGVVVGMMVTISLKELLPTAHHFSNSKIKVASSVICGMLIMAFSIVLLELAGL